MNFSATAIVTASMLGFSALILDAIGAHALSKWLPTETTAAIVTSWQTAVRIQLLHSLFLICLVLIQDYIGKNWAVASSVCTGLGVLLFCGGIYVKILASSPAIGKLAPIGGMMLMAAWLIIGIGAVATRFRIP